MVTVLICAWVALLGYFCWPKRGRVKAIWRQRFCRRRGWHAILGMTLRTIPREAPCLRCGYYLKSPFVLAAKHRLDSSQWERQHFHAQELAGWLDGSELHELSELEVAVYLHILSYWQQIRTEGAYGVTTTSSVAHCTQIPIDLVRLALMMLQTKKYLIYQIESPYADEFAFSLSVPQEAQ